MSFFRIFAQSWQQLFRHAWLWCATLIVFILAFFAVDGLFGANALATHVLEQARNRVNITVMFRAETPIPIVEQAKTYLVALPFVDHVDVTTADQALEAFRERYHTQEDVQRALREIGHNPLGAKLIIRAKSLTDYPMVVRALQVPTYEPWILAQSASDHAAAIDELSALQRAVRLVGSLLLLLFACIGLFLVFNAVRLVMFAQRDEIAIMRLVGATRARIVTPFVLSVLWVTLIAWLAVLGLNWGVYAWLLPQAGGWLREGIVAIHAATASAWGVFVWEFVIAAGLSVAVTVFAVLKYIKR